MSDSSWLLKGGYANWGVRLYKTTWQNQRPEIEIASIDFVSVMTGSAPFLIAITVEPPHP